MANFTSLFSSLSFRTRLALVMFLTMAGIGVILTLTHIQSNQQIKSYVEKDARHTSDLLTIIQTAQQKLPANADLNHALEAYTEALEAAGLSKVTSSVTLASPEGKVMKSTNPGLVGKKVKIKKGKTGQKQEPIILSGEMKDIDPATAGEQRVVQFPIVQGEKVIGYLLFKLETEELEQLVQRNYVIRLAWTLATMLAGLLAVLYLAFRFTKPINLLVEGAHQVAGGNLYVSLPVTDTDEMGRLAQTFNQMVERLRENRKLQERLNEAEKMSLLGRFAGTVAHEVRNSLNFINLSIDQIRAKSGGGDERVARDLQRNLNNVKEEISRLNRLVNDFLTAGRQAPPQLGPCDLRATLEEAVALVEKQAQVQHVMIDVELPERLGSMQCDAGQLKTCFLNIFTNAVQAMPEGGEIRVTGTSTRNRGAPLLELRFADTGPGVPAEDRERIFAPYFSTKATGFGLGLAITRKIVEDHGGRIYVAKHRKPGLEMVVELPMPEPAVAQPAVELKSPAT
jgi:nitrogen fixation/metabolism regulation signal transduction histidine kinase